MFISYRDILDRIAQEPLWWLDGVPRFDPFEPRDTNVYAAEAALIAIRCQACHTPFEVGVFVCSNAAEGRSLAEQVRQGTAPVRDPPNSDCCAAGPSMTADLLKVREFWRRDRSTAFNWTRVPELELALADSDGFEAPQDVQEPEQGKPRGPA